MADRNGKYFFCLPDGNVLPVATSKLWWRCLIAGILLFLGSLPLSSQAQFYPSLPPVHTDQLPALNKLAQTSTGHKRSEALNAMSRVYINLPLRKKNDLILAEKYAQEALGKSIKDNDAVGKSDALLVLGQLYFVEENPRAIKQLLPQADELTKAKLSIQLSTYYWYCDDSDNDQNDVNSIFFSKQAESIGQTMHNTDIVLTAKRNIAIIHLSENNKNADNEMLHVIEQYRQAGYKKLYYCYLMLAYYESQQGERAKAYDHLQIALNGLKTAHDELIAGDAYLIKSIINYQEEKYEDVIASGNKAIKYYNRQPGIYNLSSPVIYTEITTAYDKLGQKKDALNYILNVLHKYPPQTVSDSITLFRHIGSAYRETKNYTVAEHYFMQVYKLSLKNHWDMQRIYIDLGTLYLDAKQYVKARLFLTKALSLGQKNFNDAGRRLLHYRLFLADSATSHYLDAIREQNFLNQQSEYDLRKKNDESFKQMEITYQVKEREQEIKLNKQHIQLLKRQTIAQQNELAQTRKIELLSVGGVLLLLVVLTLVYYLYRQKQRSNSAMSEKNQLLQKLVSEKDWLLKEVHHRVKNNLHTIFSLLESQARTATPEAKTALEKSQHRIYAMSLFHQKVYQSANIEHVDFGLYLRDFLLFLEDSFDLENRHIRIVHDLETVLLPLNITMPLAIIVNEALTNAAKYAFKGRPSGEIHLTFKKEAQKYKLMIADNGVGIPDDDFRKNKTLGMQLMHGLCDDIGAAIKFEVHDGTQITITFTEKEITELEIDHQAL